MQPKTYYKHFFLTLSFGLLLSNANAQLHHQMLSSQGSTSKTTSGFVVTQTIGQQSVAGNYTSKDYQIGQGYQQAKWSRIITEGTSPDFQALIYPNPFSSIVIIQHDSKDDITITIFDTAGKLVFNKLLQVTTPNQSINLEKLASGVYLVQLQSNQLTYFTKLIRE
jgi:hypothetical protein|tara:strand:+ start:161 stop:658 length:498 start_codon:yes stop_codon:yes gene_type:complete